MKIVLGLGNPGARYQATRHNLGFRVVDALAKRAGTKLARRDDLTDAARVAEADLAGQQILLAEPRTYMNRSGRAASDLIEALDVPLSDLIVVYDDADLTLGRIRIRPGGGAGGHNGIRSLMDVLKTGEFPRVKLGVHGTGREDSDLADYVLEEFLPTERNLVESLVILGADAVSAVVEQGTEAAMNLYNQRSANPDPESA